MTLQIHFKFATLLELFKIGIKVLSSGPVMLQVYKTGFNKKIKYLFFTYNTMMLPEALRNLQLMTLVICLLLPLVIALFERSG